MAALQDIFAEINAVTLWQQRRADADSAAAAFNPRQVREMSIAAAMYPDIRPGALMALAFNNYRPDHPLVQQVGELSAALELQEHPGGIQFGAPGVNRNMRRARSEAMRDAAHAANQPRHPVWLDQTRPEVMQAYRSLEDAGLIEGDLVRDPKSNIDDPQSYVFREAMNALSDAGVTNVPFVRDEGDVPQLFVTTGSREPNAQGLRFGFEQAAGPRVQTDVFRQAAGQPTEPAGPGLIETAQRLSSGAPTSPAERQIAGVASGALSNPIRGGFIAMDAPVQEIQGQIRNVYALTQGEHPDWTESQSDLGILFSNPELSAGTGLFVDPESELANERRRREAERGQIGGHNVTAGRWLANSVGLDPDTKPFQLMSGITDLGVQLVDPTAIALNKAGKLRQASRLFAAPDAEDAAGLIRGLRNVIRPVNAQHWLDNAGRESVDWLTTARSPAEVWRAMNYKVSLDDAARLADTRTVAETRAVLEPMLGTSIREVSTATIGRGRAVDDPTRLMPSRGPVRMGNRDQVAFEIESFLHNAGANPGYGAPVIDKVARARTPIEVNAAVRDALRATDGLLVQAGIEDAAIRQGLVRLHENTHEAVHLTQRAALTNQGPSTAPLMVGGETVDVLDPVLMSELAPEFLSLPDARAIRRAVSDLPGIFKKGLYKPDFNLRVGAAAVEHLQNEFWKPLQLMRAAWTVRVVGEEQLRMAAAGYDSMFNHPISFIAHRVGRKGATDVSGELLDEAGQFTDAMAQTHGSWLDKAVVPTGVKTTFVKGDPARHDQFMQSWASEILKLHGDPVARQVAQSGSLDDAVEWFTRGAGNLHRGQLATAYPGRFDTVEQARGYLQGVQNRTHYMTGGDADLMEAVRTGRIGGESIMEGTGLNSRIRPTLDGKFDGFAPDVMLGEDVVKVKGLKGSWDRGVDRMFGLLMTNRTNNLSRSPTFKQAYWREAERLIGFADEATKAQVIRAAREANLGSRAIRRMERIKANGELSLDELDFLSKGHGLDETKSLLYDLSRKGRFMDAARLVFPFGEAWKEVLTRWIGTPGARFSDGLIANNPAVVRRFQQAVQGARGEDFGDFMGAPDGEGFFWKNEFGQEVFIYPGSGILTETLLGVEIPLTGSVEGLSMFGTVVPGLGPVVQIPTAWLLKSKPGPQFLREAFSAIETARVPEGVPIIGGTTAREQILPFGSPSESDMGEAANVANYLPTWARTAWNWATNGDGNERQWGNAVNATAAYLASTGNYGTSRDERQRLMEDAAFKARWFMLIKAVAQSTSPSSPSEDWRVVDENDKSLRVRALAEEYQELRDTDFESADRTFLDRYGIEILAAIQADTAGVEYSVPTTREGVAWLISNPDVQDALPHTFGFFAPKGGKFDPSLYAEQYQSGQRHLLTPEQWTRLMNTVKGNMILEDAKLEVGEDADTDEGEQYLRETREWIADNYDGWGDVAGIPRRPDTDVLMRELYDALDNDAVMATDAGQGLALYLDGRDEVLADAESRGVGLGSQEMAGGREYLAELGAWVIGEHPGFKDVYDIVLSRELRD